MPVTSAAKSGPSPRTWMCWNMIEIGSLESCNYCLTCSMTKDLKKICTEVMNQESRSVSATADFCYQIPYPLSFLDTRRSNITLKLTLVLKTWLTGQACYVRRLVPESARYGSLAAATWPSRSRDRDRDRDRDRNRNRTSCRRQGPGLPGFSYTTDRMKTEFQRLRTVSLTVPQSSLRTLYHTLHG